MSVSEPGGGSSADYVVVVRWVLVVVPLLVFASVAAPVVRSTHSPAVTGLAMAVVAGYLVTILVVRFQRARRRT